jgi:predicted alpha/beta-fold hydrolase
VRHMLVRARSKGWRVVVFNSRGCGNSPVTTPKVLLAVQDSIFFFASLSLKLYKQYLISERLLPKYM